LLRNTAEVLDHDLEKGGIGGRPSIIGHKKFDRLSTLAKQTRPSGQSGAKKEDPSSSACPTGSNEYYAIFFADDPIWRPILEDDPDHEVRKLKWTKHTGSSLRGNKK